MKNVFLLSIVLMVIAGCGVSEQQRVCKQEKEEKLEVLKQKQNLLVEKLKKQRQSIRELAQEYGSKDLEKRHEIKLERVGMLQKELTKYEALVLESEARVMVLRRTVENLKSNLTEQSEQSLATEDDTSAIKSDPRREEYVNSDSVVSELASSILQQERELMLAKQRLEPNNPEIKMKADIIENLKVELSEKKKEAASRYDNIKLSKISHAEDQKLAEAQSKLADAETEFELHKELESRFHQILNKEDAETMEIGRKQLKLKNLQTDLSLTKEEYDKITHQINELASE